MKIVDMIINIRDRFLCKFPSAKHLYLPDKLVDSHIVAMDALIGLRMGKLNTLDALDEAIKKLEYAIKQSKETNGYTEKLPLVYSAKYTENAIISTTNSRVQVVDKQKSITQQIKLAELKGEEVSPIVLQKKEKLDREVQCYDTAIEFLTELKKYTAQFYKYHKEKK